jgi:hypothetical protein
MGIFYRVSTNSAVVGHANAKCGGLSTAAARSAASGRDDESWVNGRKTKQQKRQSEGLFGVEDGFEEEDADGGVDDVVAG